MSESRDPIHFDSFFPSGYAIVTRLIIDERRPVRFMYREHPDEERDSGWRFFSGTEDQTYVDNPKNLLKCPVRTIANIDPSIVSLLNTPPPCIFGRETPDEPFRDVEFESAR